MEKPEPMTKEDLTSFEGQVVLVTGAASGIGKAAAELIAARGAQIVCLDLNEAGLKSTVSEITSAGGRATYKILDVSSQTAVKKVVGEILAEHGQIHALANSAGISGPTGKPVEEIEWAAFQKTIEINLYGTVWLTQELMPSMKANNYGRIVHLASIAGKEGNPGMAAYNASKAGVIGFVKGVAKECATFGVTINAVAPAVIRTPINETVAEDVQKYMVSKIPVGRLGEPFEVAEIIAFAASKACSFTTGFTFDVSGGRATY
jgi:2-dehydro-3-deoxy-L-rhamnonate dehydrogenase (NAD+)